MELFFLSFCCNISSKQVWADLVPELLRAGVFLESCNVIFLNIWTTLGQDIILVHKKGVLSTKNFVSYSFR
jgi:hypothetical protein